MHSLIPLSLLASLIAVAYGTPVGINASPVNALNTRGQEDLSDVASVPAEVNWHRKDWDKKDCDKKDHKKDRGRSGRKKDEKKDWWKRDGPDDDGDDGNTDPEDATTHAAIPAEVNWHRKDWDKKDHKKDWGRKKDEKKDWWKRDGPDDDGNGDDDGNTDAADAAIPAEVNWNRKDWDWKNDGKKGRHGKKDWDH
jgi:hypothetical protein